MFVKLDNFVICDSDTDGCTVYMNPGYPALERPNDAIERAGDVDYNVSRTAQKVSFEVVVGREFASDEESASFCHKHIRSLFNIASGTLKIRDMLGIFIAYKNVVLDGYDEPEIVGLGVDIKYNFTAAFPLGNFVLGFNNAKVLFGGKKIQIQQ